MNPLLLWIPGTLLLVVGIALLLTGAVSFGVGVALAVAGGLLESIGILLWLRARRPPAR